MMLTNLVCAALGGSAGVAYGADVDTTRAIAATALTHGVWLAGVGAAAGSGEPEPIIASAAATHVALFTTPVLLHDAVPLDLAGQRRMDAAWVLYYSGLGLTAAGWGLVGVTADEHDGLPGFAAMALADVALIGATALAVDQIVRRELSTPETPPPTVTIPLMARTF
jgi:hypothetical protein